MVELREHDDAGARSGRWRRLAVIVAALVATVAAAGCQSGGSGAFSVYQGDGAPPDAYRDRWQAPADRLYADIPRAMQRMEWALLRVDPPTEKALERRGRPTAEQPIRAEAMLPDNRIAHIVGYLAAGDDQVAVHVKVGHFGDPELEREYVATLKDVLADKPKPKRGIFFELPPLITGEK